MDLSAYKLIIFDLDGTLADFHTHEILPGVKKWFEQNRQHAVAIATNQGGVGLRHWMEDGGFGEPDKYPTVQDIEEYVQKVCEELNIYLVKLLVCYRYQSSKGNWSPIPEGWEHFAEWSKSWRKPNPGMLEHGVIIYGGTKETTLMVGDGIEDEKAAAAAGIDFIHADKFFGREPF